MKTKRFLSLLLCAVLIFTMLPGVALAEENGDFAGGSGTEADPWKIGNWHHLNNVRNHLDAYFKLINDLNEQSVGYAVYNTDAGWEPIGTSGSRFTGTFDGDGHTISGLFINRPGENGIGLFGYTNNAAIKNLGLVDFDVTGNDNVGGLVGVNHGNITSSHTMGNVTGQEVVGGLVGYNDGTIENSYATVSVEGKYYAGGLIGRNIGDILDSYATGSVTGRDAVNLSTGGLAGYNDGTIENSYATGNVTGRGGVGIYFGGLVGVNSSDSTINNSYATGSVDGNGRGLIGNNMGTITNSFYDSETTGLGETGVGGGNIEGVTGKTTDEMKEQETFTGWDFDTTWRIEAGQTYPYLAWEPRLATITLSSGSLSPAFNSQTSSYTASVANSISSINITATPTADHEDAAITINGTAVSSGVPSDSIPLSVGANTINVVIKAADSPANKTYTITITRESSSDAALSGLGISDGTLSPVFESGTYTYTASVGNSVTNLTVTPTVSDINGTITVNGSAVASGTASSAIALAVGENTITVIVTAQDNSTTQTYTITVTRATAPSTGGSGGGGGSVYSPPTYSAAVAGGGALNITVKTASGSASVMVSDTLGAGIQNGRNETITMPSIPGVTNYTLGIPVAYLSTPGSGTLTFNTNIGSMTLPAGMLAGIAGAEGKRAGITIGLGDKSGLSDAEKAAIGDRPLIEISLTLDEVKTHWNNPSAPVTISIPYIPTPEELLNPEAIVIWYIDGSGNPICIPNGHYDPVTGMVTFSTTHFSYFAVAYNPVSFNDVAEGSWYFKAVNFIGARGITRGTGGGNYSPNNKLSRGEFIVLLMRAYGIAPDTNPEDNFSDAGNTYYTGYLAAAKRLNISAGVGNNLFAPGREITRQEMFTLLYNALKVIDQLPQGDSGKTLSGFTDAGKIASWAKDAMNLLVKTGTVGGSNGALNPTATTTRAEMAQVLYNLLGK